MDKMITDSSKFVAVQTLTAAQNCFKAFLEAQFDLGAPHKLKNEFYIILDVLKDLQRRIDTYYEPDKDN